MPPRLPCKTARRIAHGAFLAGVCAAHGALAADGQRSGWLPDAVFIQPGLAESARSLIAGVSWPPVWHRQFAQGRAEVYWEASFGRWVGQRDADRVHSRWVTQLELAPVVRWQPAGDGPQGFVEGGIGASIVTPTYHRQAKAFSTAFNFGDHVAIGWRFGEAGQHEIAFRLQHFSNADIKQPNPGENFRQLRYTYGY